MLITNGSFNGLEARIVSALSDKFNFTYNLIDCQLNYGKMVNGSWNGMIGRLVTNVSIYVTYKYRLPPILGELNVLKGGFLQNRGLT